jgi:hypothetical protein
LNGDDTDNFNRFCKKQWNQTVINSLPTKKKLGQDGFTAKIYLTLKELTAILLKQSHKVEREGKLSNSFSAVFITKISKLNKDMSKKSLKENYGLFS